MLNAAGSQPSGIAYSVLAIRIAVVELACTWTWIMCSVGKVKNMQRSL